MSLSQEALEAKRKYARYWRAKNSDKVKAYNKAWREANPDKVKANIERYWEKQAEKSQK